MQDLGKLLQDIATRPGGKLRHAGVAAVHQILEQRQRFGLHWQAGAQQLDTMP